jgi:hypothetical protein
MLAGVAPVTAAMRDSDARTQDNPLQDNLYIAPFASWSPVCRFWLPGERVCADFYQYALVACSIFCTSWIVSVARCPWSGRIYEVINRFITSHFENLSKKCSTVFWRRERCIIALLSRNEIL